MKAVLHYIANFDDPTERRMADYDCANCLVVDMYTEATACQSGEDPRPCQPLNVRTIAWNYHYHSIFLLFRDNRAEPEVVETKDSIKAEVYTYNCRYSGRPRSLVVRWEHLIAVKHLALKITSSNFLNFQYNVKIRL